MRLDLIGSEVKVFDSVKTMYDFYVKLKEDIELYEDNREIDRNKYVEIISDPLDLSINNKKMINLLNKKLVENGIKKELFVETENIYNQIFKLLKKCNDNLFSLKYDEEIKLEALFKILDLKFEEEKDSLVEKLQRYINLLAEISNIKYIFLFNTTHLISEEEMTELVRFAETLKISIIAITVSDKFSQKQILKTLNNNNNNQIISNI